MTGNQDIDADQAMYLGNARCDVWAIERRATALRVRFLRQALTPLGRALHKMIAQWLMASEKRRSANALRTLDDRLLADIGLRREEIDNIVNGRLPVATRYVETPWAAPATQTAIKRPANTDVGLAARLYAA